MKPIKMKSDQGVEVDVADIAGHLLWDAARDFRNAYEALTNYGHLLTEDHGGPRGGEIHKGAPHTELPEGKSLSMHSFATRALGSLKDMEDALKRMALFADGEVFDTLIDETLLGPDTSQEGLRKVHIENSTGSSTTTHVFERNSGLQIYMGLNSFDKDGKRIAQPFVAIPCDDLPERFTDSKGEPILCVSVGDAEVYDNEGDKA